MKFLKELVRSKSVTGDEEDAQALVRDELRSVGARVDYWKPTVSEFKGHEGFIEEERPFDHRPNVVATLRGGLREPLAFNGHVDVVPEGDASLWRHAPYGAEVVGGRLFGRGSCDMKGGLAACVFAVKALAASGVPLRRDIMVQSVIGEESGGVGTLACILRGYRPSAAVIAEPTSLKLLTAQAGCLMFRLRVRGKAAHGASRYMGVSAVEKFQPILAELLALEERRRKMRVHPLFKGVKNPVTLSVGTVRAGNWDSTVPEELVAEGRYGVWPGEGLSEARSQFESAVHKGSSHDPWLKGHPPEVEWFGPQWESAEIPADHWLPRLVSRACAEALGGEPARGAIAGGTDMRLFTNVAGAPAVIFGPGDDRVAHFSDEWVSLDEVRMACRAYALTALAWNE